MLHFLSASEGSIVSNTSVYVSERQIALILLLSGVGVPSLDGVRDPSTLLPSFASCWHALLAADMLFQRLIVFNQTFRGY